MVVHNGSLVFQTQQGLTICISRVPKYAYFYWCTHDFGHVYVDMYIIFFPMIFLSSGSNNFILFKNLILYIIIYLFVLGSDRFFTVYVCFKETLFSNFSYKLFNKYFSLLQSIWQFRVLVRK